MAIQIKNVMYDAVRCWEVRFNRELFARVVEEPRAVIELRDVAGEALHRIETDDSDSARADGVREMKSRAITCVMAARLVEFRAKQVGQVPERKMRRDPQLR